jgi:hypothetical protein
MARERAKSLYCTTKFWALPVTSTWVVQRVQELPLKRMLDKDCFALGFELLKLVSSFTRILLVQGDGCLTDAEEDAWSQTCRECVEELGLLKETVCIRVVIRLVPMLFNVWPNPFFLCGLKGLGRTGWLSEPPSPSQIL